LKLYLALALVVISLPARVFAACDPKGFIIIGPGAGYYDHIANGTLLDSDHDGAADCWSSTANFVSDTSCSTYTNPSPTNAFDFEYGDRAAQTITVGNHGGQKWGLSYLLDFDDPHDDRWWNRLRARVVVGGVTVAQQTYWGDQATLQCARRDLTFTGNFAPGTQMQVIFEGGRAYPDTRIRVRNVSLYQYN
jgi:hypothetical protein